MEKSVGLSGKNSLVKRDDTSKGVRKKILGLLCKNYDGDWVKTSKSNVDDIVKWFCADNRYKEERFLTLVVDELSSELVAYTAFSISNGNNLAVVKANDEYYHCFENDQDLSRKIKDCFGRVYYDILRSYSDTGFIQIATIEHDLKPMINFIEKEYITKEAIDKDFLLKEIDHLIEAIVAHEMKRHIIKTDNNVEYLFDILGSFKKFLES